MAKCDHCEGAGSVEAVALHPEYGRMTCGDCGGCGSFCDYCGDPLNSPNPDALEHVCAGCSEEMAEAAHADVLADTARDSS